MTLTITRIDNQSQLGHKRCQFPRLSFMIVCVCNRLNEDRVRNAIAKGACCSEDVYARCGVRKNCGRCQETIEDMLERHPAALASAA